ncbi:MAG: hypothetical protein GY795_29985 [Desulfobacterales bacterium]|nr:hypothetical protein [Desulfobacterales bacterium]
MESRASIKVKREVLYINKRIREGADMSEVIDLYNDIFRKEAYLENHLESIYATELLNSLKDIKSEIEKYERKKESIEVKHRISLISQRISEGEDVSVITNLYHDIYRNYPNIKDRLKSIDETEILNNLENIKFEIERYKIINMLSCDNHYGLNCNLNVHNILHNMLQGNYSPNYRGGLSFGPSYPIFEGEQCFQYLQEYVPFHLPQIVYALDNTLNNLYNKLPIPPHISVLDIGSGPATVPLSFCKLSHKWKYNLTVTTVEASEGFNNMEIIKPKPTLC